LLELDDALRPLRVVPAEEVGKPETAHGFYVDEPERVFIVSSPHGPILGWRDKLYTIIPNTRFDFEDTGAERMLRITFESGDSIKMPAPESHFFDPNFHEDEKDMIDFFVWLEQRVLMPHAMALFTETK
jgi:hypothetical protein